MDLPVQQCIGTELFFRALSIHCASQSFLMTCAEIRNANGVHQKSDAKRFRSCHGPCLGPLLVPRSLYVFSAGLPAWCIETERGPSCTPRDQAAAARFYGFPGRKLCHGCRHRNCALAMISSWSIDMLQPYASYASAAKIILYLENLVPQASLSFKFKHWFSIKENQSKSFKVHFNHLQLTFFRVQGDTTWWRCPKVRNQSQWAILIVRINCHKLVYHGVSYTTVYNVAFIRTYHQPYRKINHPIIFDSTNYFFCLKKDAFLSVIHLPLRPSPLSELPELLDPPTWKDLGPNQTVWNIWEHLG